MKTKFLIVALIISLSTFSQTQNRVNINVDIRGHACAGGFGLCSSGAISEKAISNISAQKIDSNTILFVIYKSSLTIENQKSIVGKEFSLLNATDKFDFIQMTSLHINKLTLTKLGFDTKYSTIANGTYPMKIEKDRILVTFKLTEI